MKKLIICLALISTVTLVFMAPQPGCITPTYRANCKEILDNAEGFENGNYTIDPDGADGPIEPYEVFCDMITDGGGWTRCVRLSTDSSKKEWFRNNYNYPSKCKGFGQTEMLWKGFRVSGKPSNPSAGSDYSTEGGQTPWFSFKSTVNPDSGFTWDTILQNTCRGCSWRISDHRSLLKSVDVGTSTVKVKDYANRWWFDYGCDTNSGCGSTEIAAPYKSGRGHIFYICTYHYNGYFQIDPGAGYLTNPWGSNSASTGGAFEMFYR